MKAAMTRITESAKRRDTIGRNRVSLLRDTQSFGARLFDYQNDFSSDNVEKLTTVVLHDETAHIAFILKYRVQIITGGEEVISADSKNESLLQVLKSANSKVDKEEKEGDLDVNK